MQEKVWHIDDPGEKSSRVKLAKKFNIEKKVKEKSPAIAFSLSLFMWGGGQFYNDQVRWGVFFLLLMVIFYGVFCALIFSWETVTGYLNYEKIPLDNAFIALGLFYVFGVLVWAFNADHAYHNAANQNKEPFHGVDSKVFPFMCSLLVPGWGQFLNGQDKKGGVFLGLVSVSLIFVALMTGIIVFWNSFEVDHYRMFFESVLVISLLYVPFIPLIWLISSYDALKVSIDEVKKESFIKRLKYANNRRKMHGFRGIMPNYKKTVILGVVLLVLLFSGYVASPQKYYIPYLKSLQARLTYQHMVIIPYTLEQLIKITDNSDD